MRLIPVLLLMTAALLPRPAQAQRVAPPLAVSDSAPHAPKRQAAAVALGLILPGGGQYYAGRAGTGLVLTGVAAAGVALLRTEPCRSTVAGDCERREGEHRTRERIGGGLYLAAWLYGMATAPRDVRRWNARHAVSPAHVRPVLVPGIGGATRVGLAVALPRGR